MPSDNLSNIERAIFTTVLIKSKGFDEGGHGTGFLINVDQPGVGYHTFLVTNKHVIADALSINIVLHKKSIADGTPNLDDPLEIILEDVDKLFRGHPDENIDVAVAYLTPILEGIIETGLFGLHDTFIPDAFQDKDVPSDDDFEMLDALEDVVFIGYPYHWWDKSTFLPITRKACTATPVFHSHRNIDQFLIDGAVFPGSSGSPVYIYSEFTMGSDGNLSMKKSLKLAGVVAAASVFLKFGELKVHPCIREAKMGVHNDEFAHLGIVYGVDSIMELIGQWMDDIRAEENE